MESILVPVGFYHLGIALVKDLEFLAFSDISYQKVVISHPYIAVAGCKKGKYTLSCCLDRKLVDGEAIRGLVHPRQSTFCSYPDAIVMVFCHAADVVAWENSWRLGVIVKGLEEVSVITFDAIVGSYPDQSLLVNEDALLFL